MNIRTKLILLILVSVELLTVLHSLNRGFDITDEGYYLLTYQNNYHGGAELIKCHEIIKLLTFGNEPDIIEARLLRLVLTLFSGIFFSLCFFHLMKRLNPGFSKNFNVATFIIISVTGILGSYSINPQAISYNSLTLILSVIITALLLLFMEFTLNERSAILKGGVLVIIGILLGTLFFVKFTSAIALFVTTCIFIALLHKRFFKRTLLHCLIVLGSTIFTLSVYGLTNENLRKFIFDIFNIAVGLVDSQSPSNTRGIFYQALIIGSTLLKLIASMIIGAGLCLVYLRLKEYKNLLKSGGKTSAWIVNLVFLLFSLIFIFSVFYIEVLDFNNFSLQIFIIVLTFFLTWSTELSRYKEFVENGKVTVLILFILVPLSISFGTDVPYMRHLLISLIFIFSIPFLFFNVNYTRVFGWLFISLSFLAAVFVFNNNYLNPYRMARIGNYTVSIEQNPVINERIKFQPKEAEELLALADILVKHGYKRGDNLIAAYRIPGLVYLLGGTQPGGMLWGEQVEGLYLRNLSQEKPESLNRTIIITRKPLNKAFIKVLNDKGIKFPEDYKVYRNLSYGEREINTLTLYIPEGK